MILKRSIGFLTEFSVFVLIVMIVLACASGEEYDYKDFSVFAPEIIHQPANTPFFLSSHIYYYNESYDTESLPTITGKNTEEWIAYFKNNIQPEDVEWLVYTTTADDLEAIRHAVQAENKTGDRGEIVAALLTRKNYNNIIDYLLVAKQAEKLMNPREDMWEPVTYDTAAILKQKDILEKRYNSETDPFLKARYGFQVVRNLSITDRLASNHFFDSVFKPNPSSNSMYLRSLGYKARNLYRMERYGEANYIYSYLFDQDSTHRFVAHKSFHPQEEDDWITTLALAKTDKEKERLWQLYGLYANALTAMKEIYAINPTNSFLSLLLVRAVNHAEDYSISNPRKGYHFFGEDYQTISEESYFSSYYPDNLKDSAVFRELIQFTDKVISENRISDPSIWLVSSGYLHMLNENYSMAATRIEAAKKTTDSLMRGQAEIIDGILYVKTQTDITPAIEIESGLHIRKILSYKHKDLRQENAIRYMLSNLSLLYDGKKNLLKKELSFPRGRPYFLSSANTLNMIAFMKKKNGNVLEQFLLEQYPLKIADVYPILAMNYMYEHKFASAVATFRTIQYDTTSLYANPFNIRIKDCHDCDFERKQITHYDRLTFSMKMKQMKQLGDQSQNPEVRAQNYFLYANGLYNMTWYGNGRALHTTDNLWEGYGEIFYGGGYELMKNTSFFDCSEALKYYQKAFSLSKNREFKARCTWMSAKCEHNAWIDRKVDEYEREKDFVAGDYFHLMQKDFRNTAYFRDVIKECGYFRKFITSLQHSTN